MANINLKKDDDERNFHRISKLALELAAPPNPVSGFIHPVREGDSLVVGRMEKADFWSIPARLQQLRMEMKISTWRRSGERDNTRTAGLNIERYRNWRSLHKGMRFAQKR